jgi:quercetin dioxygenase-like cupin family protein
MTTLSPLLNALANLAASEQRPEAQATARALRAAGGTDFPKQPSSALSQGIVHTAALAGAHPTARLIHDAHAFLPWQDSPAASLQPTDLRSIKSVVTLLGPDAPIASENFLFGLFYQAPGSYYPLHAHNAAETYTILSGTAYWRAGDRRFTLNPGDASFHPPNLPHAMRAGPNGFLATWRWSGDISFDSYVMLPDPDAIQG